MPRSRLHDRARLAYGLALAQTAFRRIGLLWRENRPLTLRQTFPAALIFLALMATGIAMAGDKAYCVAELPTPVLNTPDFEGVFGGENGMSVRTDEEGMLRALELIALPGTVFEVVAYERKSYYSIFEVTTDDYPSEHPLYIDSRFVMLSGQRPPPRAPEPLPESEILGTLEKLIGQSYLWGGNHSGGICQMLDFYPPKGTLPRQTLSLWRMEGVDCSGLIYEASGGYTPRNTVSMTGFGQGLPLQGLSSREIRDQVKPLDLMVWPGHVVIVLDSETAIESTHPEGVITSNLLERIEEILEDRKALDEWDSDYKEEAFVIRRWHKGPVN